MIIEIGQMRVSVEAVAHSIVATTGDVDIVVYANLASRDGIARAGAVRNLIMDALNLAASRSNRMTKPERAPAKSSTHPGTTYVSTDDLATFQPCAACPEPYDCRFREGCTLSKGQALIEAMEEVDRRVARAPHFTDPNYAKELREQHLDRIKRG